MAVASGCGWAASTGVGVLAVAFLVVVILVIAAFALVAYLFKHFRLF